MFIGYNDPDPTAVPAPPESDPASDAAFMAALEAGIAGEAMPEPPAPPPPKDPAAKPDAPKDGLETAIDGKPAAKPADGTDPATVPGTPEHAAAEAAKAAAKPPAKPGEKPAEPAAPAADTPEAKAAAERKAALDKELDADGVRNAKTRERIHKLTDALEVQKPIFAELEKVGVKDAAAVQVLIGNAAAAVDMVGMVRQTGMSADQYTLVLDYGALNTKSDAGDAKAGAQMVKWLQEETERVCALHGIEAPTLGDPLAKHADLVADVAAEKITRERALEVAGARAVAARTAAAAAADTDTLRAQAARTKEVNEGKAALTAVGNELAGTTPEARAKYKTIEARLVAAIPQITKDYPPKQWAATVRLLGQQLLATAVAAPAAAPAKPGAPPAGNVGPSRSSGPTPYLAQQFDDPARALEAGIAAADAGY